MGVLSTTQAPQVIEIMQDPRQRSVLDELREKKFIEMEDEVSDALLSASDFLDEFIQDKSRIALTNDGKMTLVGDPIEEVVGENSVTSVDTTVLDCGSGILEWFSQDTWTPINSIHQELGDPRPYLDPDLVAKYQIPALVQNKGTQVRGWSQYNMVIEDQNMVRDHLKLSFTKLCGELPLTNPEPTESLLEAGVDEYMNELEQNSCVTPDESK